MIEFCDGWFPRAGTGFDPTIAVTRLRSAAEAAGRDPKTLSITVFRAPPEAAAQRAESAAAPSEWKRTSTASS